MKTRQPKEHDHDYANYQRFIDLLEPLTQDEQDKLYNIMRLILEDKYSKE